MQTTIYSKDHDKNNDIKHNTFDLKEVIIKKKLDKYPTHFYTIAKLKAYK